MLQPFVVTSWHGKGEASMPADIREIFQQSEAGKDPRRLNVFMFALDHAGRFVHGFHGTPAARGVVGNGRSDYSKEISLALAKLKLPTDRQKHERPVVLPDLKATGGRTPAGVRLLIHTTKGPVVEVAAMPEEGWKALAFPGKAMAKDAAVLRNWLVHLYPPVLSGEANRPYTRITGSLKLEPAGADKQGRYALLRGAFKMAKGDDEQPAFEGTVQAVLTYRLNAAEVRSVRAVVEGNYLYRNGKTHRPMPIVAAVESRPE